MSEIEPGKKVKVVVTSEPRSEGAAKTLARLFLKDPTIAKTRTRKPKPTVDRRRSGRIWSNPRRGTVAVRPRQGDSCELVCTLDMVRDLASVERYVEITSV